MYNENLVEKYQDLMNELDALKKEQKFKRDEINKIVDFLSDLMIKPTLDQISKVECEIKIIQKELDGSYKSFETANLFDSLKKQDNFKESKETLMDTKETPTDFIISLRNGDKKDIIVDMVKIIEKNDKPLGSENLNAFGESDLDEMFGS